MIMEDMKTSVSTWPSRLSSFLRLVYGLEKAAESSGIEEPEVAADSAQSSTEKEVEPVWVGSTREGKMD